MGNLMLTAQELSTHCFIYKYTYEQAIASMAMSGIEITTEQLKEHWNKLSQKRLQYSNGTL